MVSNFSGGGGLQFWGGWSPIFRGGLVSNFSGGGVSNFSGGSPIFRGGLQFFGGAPIFGGGELRNTVNVRPVRILLECILVKYLLTVNMWSPENKNDFEKTDVFVNLTQQCYIGKMLQQDGRKKFECRLRDGQNLIELPFG